MKKFTTLCLSLLFATTTFAQAEVADLLAFQSRPYPYVNPTPPVTLTNPKTQTLATHYMS